LSANARGILAGMQRAPTLDAYRAAPAGCFLAGEGWLSFCARPALWGFALWGRVEAAALPSLLAGLRCELDDHTAPHASLVDARRLVGVDPAAFEALSGYVQTHHKALGRQVKALAIVHPAGFEGAVVAGFFDVLPPPYPVHLAATVEAGLGWLGEGDDEVRAVALALNAAVAEASGEDPLRASLRALLRQDPRLTLDAAARALGVSGRTLQRRLAEHQSSFSDEQAAVRLALALLRITQTKDPLTHIALDAGFASLQHLGQAVRRETGRSPSALRAARQP
jgi:AraC-like DNA-binding protein